MVSRKIGILSIVGFIGLAFEVLQGLQSIDILPFPLPLFGSHGILVNYIPALAMLIGTLSALWIGYRFGVWRRSKSPESAIQKPHSALFAQNPKLDELERGLAEILIEPTQTFMTSGDTYIGKIPFRERVNKYILLETEAEALLAVNRDDFYVNPDLFEASQSNSAHLTDLISKLLRKVKESRATIQTYEEAIAQIESITYYPIIGTRRYGHRAEVYDDVRLDHLQAYLFYPFWYYLGPLSHWMGKHRDQWELPRRRIIVNTTTKKAFPLRGPNANTLIYPVVRIRCNPKRASFPYSHIERFCVKRQWDFDPDWTPTSADLKKVTT